MMCKECGWKRPNQEKYCEVCGTEFPVVDWRDKALPVEERVDGKVYHIIDGKRYRVENGKRSAYPEPRKRVSRKIRGV